MFSEDDSTGLHFPQSHSFQNFLIDDRMSVFKTDSQLENTSFPNIQHSKQPRRLHPIKTAVWRRFSSSLVIRPGDDITRHSESVVDEARPSPWSVCVCVWCDQAPHCLSAVQQGSTAATIQDFVSNISAAPTSLGFISPSPCLWLFGTFSIVWSQFLLQTWIGSETRTHTNKVTSQLLLFKPKKKRKNMKFSVWCFQVPKCFQHLQSQTSLKGKKQQKLHLIFFSVFRDQMS